ncbi:MAG: chemotaxis protein CheA [Spirochaetales bacterium]
MSDYLDPNNEELLKDFFGEAQGQVDVLEQNVLVLENDPANKDAVDEIFRAAHTLKGGAATVQMFELSEFTHVVEDVLDEIRSGAVKMTERLVDILLQSIDVVKAMLDERLQGRVYSQDVGNLKSSLKSFLPGAVAKKTVVAAPVKAAPAAVKAVKASSSKSLTEYDLLELKEAAAGEKVYQVTVGFDEKNPMNSVGGIQVFSVLKGLGTVLKTVPEFDKLYEDAFWPVVEYYCLLKKPLDEVERRCTIREVTLTVEITELTDDTVEVVKPKANVTPAANKVAQAAPSGASAGSSVPAAPPVSEVVDEDRGVSALLPQGDHKKAAQSNSGSILRVDSKRIDNLLNLVSETVINKATFNQISTHFMEVLGEMQTSEAYYKDRLKELFDRFPQYVEEIQKGKSVKDLKKEINDDFAKLFTTFDPIEARLKSTVGVFRSTSQNLGRIIGELHEGVLRIRMVPIAQIFSRFPRLVRDLSKTLNKKINLVIEGEETELDKSVIEDLLDPLIHCVRNSIDHGIESPEVRRERGKPEEGRVVLAARNEGNMIIIEIGDDGNGIDVEVVKQKAVDKGLIHPSKTLTDLEAFNLIFEAGFSTAASITSISGRGVGLDVVRKQIEKLNGNVSIWSEKGKGSKFTIKLPLTLAIIQGLLVRVGNEVYAIPITSVVDSHRIRPADIKIIDNYEVFNVRKDVISLLRLNRLFGIPADEGNGYHYVVVVGSGDKKMGLIVDSLIGEEDVVIKPLKDRYTASPGIAGATILGDGKVSLIIDVSQLLDLGMRNERLERQRRENRSR